MARPFFIIGLARSGTNLVARMLDRHSQVSVALDPFMPVFKSLRDAIISQSANEFLQRRYPSGQPFQDYYFDPLGPTLLDAILAADLDIPLATGEIDRLRDKCTQRASLESSLLGACMRKLTGSTYAELFDSMFTLLSELSPNVKWIGCKEVWIEDFIPLLARSIPMSRFICIERDPRAIVASLLALSETDSSQLAHAPSYMRHWRKSISLNRQRLKDPELAGRFHLVSYESIIRNAEANAYDLSQFLDIDYQPGMVELSEGGWMGNSSYKYHSQDVYKDSLFRWRTQLTDAQISSIEYLCGPEMRLTDYFSLTRDCISLSALNYLLYSGRETVSWRSDSGDEFADLSGEALRHVLLDACPIDSELIIRRCFLFSETHHAIRNAGKKGVLL